MVFWSFKVKSDPFLREELEQGVKQFSVSFENSLVWKVNRNILVEL